MRFWSVTRSDKTWEEAEVRFVSAGKTLGNKPPDEDPEIIHVDTGLGKFDHHQDKALEPACGRILEELARQDAKFTNDQALKRLIAVVADADVGNYIHWPESQTDRYEFSLDGIIGGLNKHGLSDERIVEIGLTLLDGVYSSLRRKVKAEKILKEGVVFKTIWGRGISFETSNDLVLDLGEKKGYSVAVRKDPRSGSVRIYARNDRGVDLTQVWEKLKEKDPKATWFLHQSKCLLLNGSGKNQEMKPTRLTLKEVTEVLRSI